MTDLINDLLTTIARDAGIHDWRPATDDELAGRAGMTPDELRLRVDIMGGQLLRDMTRRRPDSDLTAARRLWRALDRSRGGRDLESLDGRQISGARGGAPRSSDGFSLVVAAQAVISRGWLDRFSPREQETVRAIAEGQTRRQQRGSTRRHARVAASIRKMIAGEGYQRG